MGERDLRFRVYSWLVAVAAAAGFAITWNTSGYARQLPLLLTLTGAVIVSELLAVELPNGASMSLTYPLGVCAIVLFGPTGAAGLAILSTVPFLFAHSRATLARTSFNLGQVAITALLPAAVYGALRGQYWARLGAGETWTGIPVVPGLVAATLGLVVNFALGAVGYSMLHNIPIGKVWRQVISWMVAPQVALGLLGLAIAQVMISHGPLGFALFVVPLIVARQTHSRYLSLRETYADTVRSLVAALEAKDPYTKGHSVRVAGFAVAIAQAMSLDESAVQSIEYAALLHDLGKIGISRGVLSKDEALTAEEYDRIREHPAIAARILESVPFLSEVLPAVRDHHERLDGRGYGRGVRAPDISRAARILAVADSYDAMTADRPYRAALDVDAAVQELQANSGTQFDPEIVEAFLEALPSLDASLAAAEIEPKGDTSLAHA